MSPLARAHQIKDVPEIDFNRKTPVVNIFGPIQLLSTNLTPQVSL